MSVPPYRSRRDRHGGGGFAADYYDSDQAYGDSRRYAPEPSPRSRRHHDDSGRPSRRHMSEHRRPAYEDAYEKPSRHGSRREAPTDRPDADAYYAKRRGAPGPMSPSYGREPDRSRRREDDRDRERRSRRSERSSMPPLARQPYEDYPPPGYAQDRKADRRSSKYRAEPDPRQSPRHPRRRSPSPEPRTRRHDPAMPKSRPGHRDYDDHYGPPPRRARSSERPRYDFDRSPPRGRSKDQGRGKSRGSREPGRRQSVPPSAKRGGGPNQWWHNPMLQAGARYAFTAGAQAALRNKDEPGQWMGPKGAKVATAALSAALMDGIIAQKQK